MGNNVKKFQHLPKYVALNPKMSENDQPRWAQAHIFLAHFTNFACLCLHVSYNANVTLLCDPHSLSLYVCSGCFSSKAEDRLFRRLFRKYNQFIRPVENVSDPVTVEFQVSISQLVKVVSPPHTRMHCNVKIAFAESFFSCTYVCRLYPKCFLRKDKCVCGSI